MSQLIKVDSVKHFSGSLRMYDLTVENDETYIANGIVVHNTELCRSLDGKMWSKDDPEIALYQPPNHFNCRSILTPVFRGDEPGEWDEAPQDLEPAEGFGGSVGSRVKPAGSTRHPGYE